MGRILPKFGSGQGSIVPLKGLPHTVARIDRVGENLRNVAAGVNIGTSLLQTAEHIASSPLVTSIANSIRERDAKAAQLAELEKQRADLEKRTTAAEREHLAASGGELEKSKAAFERQKALSEATSVERLRRRRAYAAAHPTHAGATVDEPLPPEVEARIFNPTIHAPAFKAKLASLSPEDATIYAQTLAKGIANGEIGLSPEFMADLRVKAPGVWLQVSHNLATYQDELEKFERAKRDQRDPTTGEFLDGRDSGNPRAWRGGLPDNYSVADLVHAASKASTAAEGDYYVSLASLAYDAGAGKNIADTTSGPAAARQRVIDAVPKAFKSPAMAVPDAPDFKSLTDWLLEGEKEEAAKRKAGARPFSARHLLTKAEYTEFAEAWKRVSDEGNLHLLGDKRQRFLDLLYKSGPGDRAALKALFNGDPYLKRLMEEPFRDLDAMRKKTATDAAHARRQADALRKETSAAAKKFGAAEARLSGVHDAVNTILGEDVHVDVAADPAAALAALRKQAAEIRSKVRVTQRDTAKAKSLDALAKTIEEYLAAKVALEAIGAQPPSGPPADDDPYAEFGDDPGRIPDDEEP